MYIIIGTKQNNGISFYRKPLILAESCCQILGECSMEYDPDLKRIIIRNFKEFSDYFVEVEKGEKLLSFARISDKDFELIKESIRRPVIIYLEVTSQFHFVDCIEFNEKDSTFNIKDKATIDIDSTKYNDVKLNILNSDDNLKPKQGIIKLQLEEDEVIKPIDVSENNQQDSEDEEQEGIFNKIKQKIKKLISRLRN